MKISGFHFLGLLALISAGACGAAEERPEEIISIADARARVAYPMKEAVTVEGRVTFCSERLGIAYVQDKTGGICFDPRGASEVPRAGDFVKVTGVVVKRRELIMLHTSEQPPLVVVRPPADFGVEPLLLDLDDAGKAHLDGLLTRVTGVVRSVTAPLNKKSLTSVEISFPNGSATVLLPWSPSAEVQKQWLNSMVVCNGVLVCPAPPALTSKEADALLLVPDRKSWGMRRDVLDEFFAQAPTEDVAQISAARRLNVEGLTARRLHLSGVVTGALPKQWVCLRIPGRSVQVMTDQVDRFEPGTRVSVACCPQMRRGNLVLLDGIFRRTGAQAEEVSAVRLEDDAVGAAALPMELVQLRGVLRNDPDWRGLPFLSLTSRDGTRFAIQWELFLSQDQSRALKSGSEVLLTGIVKPLAPKTRGDDAAAFALIPRSAEDVQVLSSPSWWTRSRLMTAAGWLAVLAMMGVCTTLVSRWQIRRQRRAVREAEALAIAMEERGRIARELHDSLQQHLAGAALHVEAIQGAVATIPQMLPQLLGETAAMIRHCQIEARHCIWDLRSSTPGSEDLAGALAGWVTMRSAQLHGITLGFQQEGEVPALRRDEIYQILRITQEAVNNAVAHADARQINVRLMSAENGLQVTVTDDGRGFDVNAALLRSDGHFGLRSQRERSARIRAGLEFDSQLQRGTRVTLRVATNSSPR